MVHLPLDISHYFISTSLKPVKSETVTLLSRDLEEPVRAQVINCDLPHGMATLGSFQFAGAKIGDRAIARVVPKEPVEVSMVCGEHTFTGRLADISVDGLGIVLPPGWPTAVLRPRVPVSLTVPLPPPVDTTLHFTATIRFVRPEGDLLRVGVMFDRETRSLAILPYVHARQEEILAELKDLYDARMAQAI